jgi:hypothetical protein
MSDESNVINLRDVNGQTPHSVNNRLIVEAYLTDRSLKAKESNGFAMIQQKVAVKGLRLLMDAMITQTSGVIMVLEKGARVFIREELLHTQPWAQKILESDEVDGKFMIVDFNNVEFVSPS